MKSLANRDPYRLGLVAAAVGVVLAIIVTIVSTISWGATTYTAHMAQSAGLKPGEDVQVAGVHVGQVKSIELKDRDVVVTFTLSNGIKLGKDSRAEIKVATLLGTHYLAVDPLGSGQLKDNTIPVSQTGVPFNLQDAINEGTGALEDLDADLLARALSAMADTTDAASRDFGPALQGISRISSIITTRSGQVGELLKAANGVSDQLSDSSADLVDLMKQTQLILDEIQTRRAAIHALLVKTAALARSLNVIITKTSTDIDGALRDVNKVLDMLRGQDKRLRTALKAIGPSVRYLNNSLGNGPWIDVNAQTLVPDSVICHEQGTC